MSDPLYVFLKWFVIISSAEIVIAALALLYLTGVIE